MLSPLWLAASLAHTLRSELMRPSAVLKLSMIFLTTHWKIGADCKRNPIPCGALSAGNYSNYKFKVVTFRPISRFAIFLTRLEL